MSSLQLASELIFAANSMDAWIRHAWLGWISNQL